MWRDLVIQLGSDGNTAMKSYQRYSLFPAMTLPDRTWPDRAFAQAPRWLSTDLRDGNQALASPMCKDRKLAMFELLTDIGYREIEAGFPAASQDDFDFLRLLIEEDRIPDDVRISVLVQARDELIRRTVAALVGARRATIHLYNATAPLFREVVLGVDRQQCKDMAVRGTRLMMRYAEEALGDCDFGFEYSPEIFNETEPEFILEICEAVMEVWQPERDREIILNFPSTIERSLPTTFADQIEWVHRNLSRREHVCLSVHPHNDRGTAVAAAELAVLAGAQRIEGCLFGNGERAGNVCLVTLGMNLLSQGIDPGIDFSDLDRIRRTVEHCNQLPVHPRHPYGGELVFTAFSGSHQDAIKKGFEARDCAARAAGVPVANTRWYMPYLPVDPKDVGRTYEAVIRVNSQSGKGGVAYVMSACHALNLPRGLQIEFAQLVQACVNATGSEISPAQLWQLFNQEYVMDPGRANGTTDEAAYHAWDEGVIACLHVEGRTRELDEDQVKCARTIGAALASAGVDVRSVLRQTWTQPPNAEPTAVAAGAGFSADQGVAVYAECTIGERMSWGVGLDRDDLAAAAVAAVRTAVRRAAQPRIHDPADLHRPALSAPIAVR